MPIYEYACKKCDGEFEISQRITDEPLKRYLCPHCGKRTAVAKLISRSSFHLKGSGWYATDYGKNGANRPTQTIRRRANPKAARPRVTQRAPAPLRPVRVRLNRRVLPPPDTDSPSYTVPLPC